MSFAVPLIAAGVSAVGGALSGRGKTTTSTPTYTPAQTAVQGRVASTIEERLANPRANLDPLKAAAIGGVNRTYAGLQDRLASTFAGRGFGRSGKLVTNAKQLEIARAGDIGGIESKFAGMQLDYENQVVDQAMRFGFAAPGATQQIPGNMIGGAISSGAETFTTLYALDRLLKGRSNAPAIYDPSVQSPVYGDD